MTERIWHTIWMEQCDVADVIKVRYGLAAAFDYAVGEKLLKCAQAASQRLDSARDLPRFVSRVRTMFTTRKYESAFHASNVKFRAAAWSECTILNASRSHLRHPCSARRDRWNAQQ